MPSACLMTARTLVSLSHCQKQVDRSMASIQSPTSPKAALSRRKHAAAIRANMACLPCREAKHKCDGRPPNKLSHLRSHESCTQAHGVLAEISCCRCASRGSRCIWVPKAKLGRPPKKPITNLGTVTKSSQGDHLWLPTSQTGSSDPSALPVSTLYGTTDGSCCPPPSPPRAAVNAAAAVALPPPSTVPSDGACSTPIELFNTVEGCEVRPAPGSTSAIGDVAYEPKSAQHDTSSSPLPCLRPLMWYHGPTLSSTMAATALTPASIHAARK